MLLSSQRLVRKQVYFTYTYHSLRWLSGEAQGGDRGHGARTGKNGPRRDPSSPQARGEAVKGAAYQYFRGKEPVRNDNWVAGVKNAILPRRGSEYHQRSDLDSHPSFPSPSPGRIVNTRKKFAKTNAVRGQRRENADSFDANGPTYTPRKSRKYRNNESEEDSYDSVIGHGQIPPNIIPQLFDMMSIQQKIEDKQQIDVKGFDHGDKFLAELIGECLKNDHGVYHGIFTSKQVDEVEVPVARSTERLLRVSLPDIQEDKDSIGYKLGCNAWQVLSKNYYFSEADCKYMSQTIARMSNEILTAAREQLETDK